MKTQHIHQEFVISTKTTFAQKALVEINEGNEKISSVEKLVEAIWNGSLNEMFAELVPPTLAKRPNIFNWGIYTGTSYLLVDLANVPVAVEPSRSIDPHLILADVHLN